MTKKEDTWYKNLPHNSDNNPSNSDAFPTKKVQEGYDFLKKSQYQKNNNKSKKPLSE